MAHNKIRSALDYWYAEALKGCFLQLENKDRIGFSIVHIDWKTNDRIFVMCYDDKTLICKFVISKEMHMAIVHNIGMIPKLLSKVVYEIAKKVIEFSCNF